MRKTISRIMALGMFLASGWIVPAFAGDTPVVWNAGRAYIDNHHIVIRFADGETMRLTNLRVYDPQDLEEYRAMRRRLENRRRQELLAAAGENHDEEGEEVPQNGQARRDGNGRTNGSIEHEAVIEALRLARSENGNGNHERNGDSRANGNGRRRNPQELIFQYGSPDEFVTDDMDRLFRLNAIPKRGEPIDGVTIVKIDFSPNETFLLWLASDRSRLELATESVREFVLSQRIQRDGSGQWGILRGQEGIETARSTGQYTVLKALSGDFAIDDVAVIESEGGDFSHFIAAHDRAAGQICFLGVKGPAFNDGVRVSVSDLPRNRVTRLPSYVGREGGIDRYAHVSFNAQSGRLTIVPRSPGSAALSELAAGQPPVAGGNGHLPSAEGNGEVVPRESNGQAPVASNGRGPLPSPRGGRLVISIDNDLGTGLEEEAPLDDDERKAGRRYIHDSTVERIREVLPEIPESAPRFSLGAIIEGEISRGLEPKLRIEAPGETRILVIDVPDTFFVRGPRLVNALGTNVLDSFEAVFSRGGERSLGYFRFPRNDFERGALADMVEQHLRTNVGEDQGRAQFLFLDALPIHAKHPAYHSLDFEIASVIDRVAEIPGLNVTVVLLGRRENIRRLREHKKVQAVTDFVKVDTCLDSASQLGLVRHALAAEQVYVSEDFIGEVVARIQRDSEGNTQPLANLDNFVAIMTSVLTFARYDFEDSETVGIVANGYRKLDGDTQPPPFAPEVINAPLRFYHRMSASSPTHDVLALINQDAAMDAIGRRLSTWLGYGSQNGSLSSINVLLGDNGNGKTSFVNAIPKAMPAGTTVLKVVNVSSESDESQAATNGYGSYGQQQARPQGRPTAEVLREIRQAVHELRLDPRPVKVLLVDELHTQAEILKALLSATGNADSRHSAINFDGIVVFFAMNTTIDKPEAPCEEYRKLVRLEVGEDDYFDQTAGLFVRTFRDIAKEQKVPLDEPTIRANAGRLAKGMFFFKPRENTPEQQENIIRKAISDFEDRHNVTLILNGSARDALATRIAVKTSNFRVVDVVSEMLAEAFKDHGLRNLQRGGVYLLETTETESRIPRLHLQSVHSSPEGSRYIIGEVHRMALSNIIDSLSKYVTILEESLENRPHSETDLRTLEIYRLYLRVLRVARERPLFLPNRGSELPLVQYNDPPLTFPYQMTAVEEGRAEALIRMSSYSLFSLQYLRLLGLPAKPNDEQIRLHGQVIRFAPAPERTEPSSADPELPEVAGVPVASGVIVERAAEETTPESSEPSAERENEAAIQEEILKQISTIIRVFAQGAIRNAERGGNAEWARIAVRAFESGQSGGEIQARRRREYQFMQQTVETWRKLQGKLEEANERARRTLLIDWGAEFERSLQKLLDEDPNVNVVELRELRRTLLESPSGDFSEAERLLRQAKEAMRKRAAENEVGLAESYWPIVAAAYATDFAIRKWAEHHFAELATLRLEDVRTADPNAPADCGEAIASYMHAPAVTSAVDAVFADNGQSIADWAVRWQSLRERRRP